MKSLRSPFIGRVRTLSVAGLALIVVVDAAQAVEGNTRPKNVILMIADGTGANTIAATGMYTGKLGKQIFDGPDWTKSYVSTYPLRTGRDSAPRTRWLDPGSGRRLRPG